ncbi:MAG TPA: hypothetical protein VKP12_11355, partial [Kiloniellaceae bacterium]|nr:hypothetical protein [Kiloniellaceae bacterium]
DTPASVAPAADLPGRAAPAPAAPAASGPTPLLPTSGAAPGAQQSDSSRPQAAPAPAGTSAILAAAERLMQPPEWADFEPGSLLDAAPAQPPAAEAESGAGAAEADSTPQVEAFGLSMLVIEAGATVA